MNGKNVGRYDVGLNGGLEVGTDVGNVGREVGSTLGLQEVNKDRKKVDGFMDIVGQYDGTDVGRFVVGSLDGKHVGVVVEGVYVDGQNDGLFVGVGAVVGENVGSRDGFLVGAINVGLRVEDEAMIQN